MSATITVYSAVSMDGYLAGESDELDWLGDPGEEIEREEGTLGFEEMLAQTGAMIMGRRTFDVVRGFGGRWPYEGSPVLVATHREIEDPPGGVRPIEGTIQDICLQAAQVAGDAPRIYIDGGALISQALEADLIDEMILTIVPIFLGHGIALYQGEEHQRMSFVRSGVYGDFLQVFLRRDV